MENLVVLDCEIYPNYFLVAFKNMTTGKSVGYEAYGKNSKLTEEAIQKIKSILLKRTTIGFNSLNFDLPIIMLALTGATVDRIHSLCGEIINGVNGEKIPTFKLLQRWNLKVPKSVDHIDIISLNVGAFSSLKLYGGRLHSKKLQDLPYDPDFCLTDTEIQEVKRYCINDLDTTIDLFNSLKPKVEIREDLNKVYDVDVRSRSDAQIAEDVFKKELTKITGEYPKRLSSVARISTFKYQAPDFIDNYAGRKTRELIDKFEKYTILRKDTGTTKIVDFDGNQTITESLFNNLEDKLDEFRVTIGTTTYKLGFGGIHSEESNVAYIPNKTQELIDRDVASYYPAIILNMGLYPKHLGKDFLSVYKKIVNNRLKAKKEGDKSLNECLKIVINGSFGKFGNKWSILYSPDLLLTVTITGQLSLLMLIEELEHHHIKVVSANTDGFVSLVDNDKKDLYNKIVERWEKNTGFITEETKYKGLYSKDVNNYLAIKEDNSWKGKGVFTLNESTKNPDADITKIAVVDYLMSGKPIEETIRECRDITKFLVIAQVKGKKNKKNNLKMGGYWKGNYLGKVVRWYYGVNGDNIYYENGDKVPDSDGAVPMMEIIEKHSLPEDLNYTKYNTMAKELLEKIGVKNV